MEAYCASTCLKKVTFAVILIFNIVVGIIVICVIASQSNSNPSSVTDKLEAFRLSLEKTYEEVHMDTQPSTTQTKVKAEKTPSLEFLSLLKPVVHLSGLDFDGSLTENGSTTIRNWAVSEGSERSLMYNGMNFERGSITVPVTGLYFVYSHVKFYVEDNKRSDKQRMFNHSLSKYNALTSSETHLLHNKMTECKEGINEGAHLEYPSDIRGIVHLNAGDQIFSRVSHFDLLKHDRDWHYIGAYLL